jgi:hypothetical protein
MWEANRNIALYSENYDIQNVQSLGPSWTLADVTELAGGLLLSFEQVRLAYAKLAMHKPW